MGRIASQREDASVIYFEAKGFRGHHSFKKALLLVDEEPPLMA